MSRTVILGYTKQADAAASAANYANDHKVIVIGPTDQVMMARELEDGTVWRSGATADLYVVIATKDDIPRKP